jgi:hypothetical protein
MAIPEEWLSKHVSAEMISRLLLGNRPRQTIEELLEVAFPVGSALRLSGEDPRLAEFNCTIFAGQ